MGTETARGLLVARRSFWTAGDGRPRLVNQGTVWAASSGVVQTNPDRFDALEIHGLDDATPAAPAAPVPTKRELLERAAQLGIDVPSRATNDEITAAIVAEELRLTGTTSGSTTST